MFPTFTGNSRRTRNVNLSGQKNKNPFAATAFSPSAAAGASKTVADAQAERRQRQVERDRLKAAQQIQRSWRGHAVRQSVKNTRRAEFDELYSSGEADGLGLRLQLALPLFFAFFDASNKTDLERLGLLVADLEKGGCKSFARQRQILQALVEALQQSAPVVHPQLLLLLLRIIHANPHVLVDRCQQYYYMLSKYFQQQPSTQDRTLLLQAAYAPLISGCLLDGPNAHHEPWLTSPTHQAADEKRAISLADVTLQEAYGAFASVLLISAPGLSSQTSTFARHVSISKLAFAILRLYASPRLEKLSRDHLLWLLAHFIALQKAQKDTRREMLYLKALYVQLSALNSDIRQRLDTSGNPEPSGDELFNNDQQIGSPLPSFVSEHLLSLVDRDELSLLLEQLKLDHSKVAEHSVDIASLLAGYTLVLLRCFPSQAEDIRMRLYLTDVTSTEGRTPSVKFFWNAVRKTEAFARVVSNPEATLTFLLQRNHFPGSANDSVWDREWRTILLFLELYIFVLRLTDDEDFRAGFRAGLSEGAAPSRVQQCAMTLDELKSLTLFLKNLAFTLQYHAAELLQDSSGRSQPGSQVHTQTFNVISGMDFSDFKTLVTTSVRLLYERDSRRPFLPAGHWLMTSKFDMEAFLSAVVLEQEQQADMRDTEDGDDDQDADNDAMDVDHQAITLAGQRRSRYAMMESFRQRQRKAQRERTLALIGPKLAVLKNMPYVIPFDIRVQIFRQFVFLDKHRRRHGNIDPDQWRMYMVSQNGGGWNPNNIAMRQVLGKHTATIKRGQLFTDAFRQFFPLGEGLKEPIQITFMDKFDTEEAGIDGGGVTKEFLVSVTREAFSNEHALFVSNSHNALYPNPCALDQAAETLRAAGVPKDSEGWNAHIKNLLERFEFLGRVVGKCLYEGILIDVAFAGFFLLNWTWAGTDSSTTPRANINDLRELDEELYQGMLQLKHYPGDVAELGLDFTISDQVSQPGEPVRTVTRELVPGGEHQPVTNENRPLYISYVARHRLARQPWAQTRAFIRGLSQIIDPAWLSMFNQSELQRLVGGDSSEIDVEDLRRHTVYSGLYAVGDDGQEHPTVRLFWRVMHELRDEERRDVLKYVTSTPRAPLLGFAQLEPKFSIRDGGRDQDRLPSASTCVNLLKLPQYETAEVLKSKLLYAVTSGAGFDLS